MEMNISVMNSRGEEILLQRKTEYLKLVKRKTGRAGDSKKKKKEECKMNGELNI